MFDIIYSPLKAISKAKRVRSYGRTFLVLFVASVFSGIIPVVSKSFFALSPWKFAIGLGAGLFVVHIILAGLLQLVMHILTQRGGFYEGLTTSAYGFFILAVSFLVTTLISYLKPYIGVLPTTIVTTAILIVSFIMSYAVTLRAAVELFQSDLFTVIIAMIIVYTAIVIAAYIFMLKRFVGGMTSFDAVSSVAKGGIGGISSLPGMNPFG